MRGPTSRPLSEAKVVNTTPNEIPGNLPIVQDHARLFRDFTFVYPVISRRSRGLSIGINLNPDKVCNFDCVYCEVDRRTPGKATSLDLVQMREELVWMLRCAQSGELALDPKFAGVAALTRDIKDIAFSGDGEPTAIDNFAACVQIVADVRREERLTATKIILITDGAGLDKLDVQRGLQIMDANNGEIWAKLDAGTEEYYRLVNRSHVRFERILSNLLLTARSRPIVIQSLFVKLHGEGMAPAELVAYCSRLRDLVKAGAQIKEVHAYTLARPAPEPFVSKLSKGELEGLAASIRTATHLEVFTFD